MIQGHAFFGCCLIWKTETTAATMIRPKTQICEGVNIINLSFLLNSYIYYIIKKDKSQAGATHTRLFIIYLTNVVLE